MFLKGNGGLGAVLLPIDAAASVLACLCMIWSGVTGWVIVPLLVGSWIGCFVLVTVLILLVMYIITLGVDLKRPVTEKFPGWRRYSTWFLGGLCRLGRIRLTVEGMDQLPEGRYLLVSNHRSGFDPIVTGWVFRGRDLAFITKPENLHIPIAGKFIHKCCYLPIDRENPRNAIVTINSAADLIRRDVASVGVYPEGTRSHGTEMGSFHNGVFKVAQKSGVPIVVLTVDGTEKVTENMPLHATDVTVRICKVIDAETVGDTSTAELGIYVRRLMEDSLAPEYAQKI